MIGMSLQLFCGVINWGECLGEKGAWDTLIWFPVLIGMAGQLQAMGFVDYLASSVAAGLSSMSLEWPQVFALLHVSYFGIHYFFASQTAQAVALNTAFIAMMLAAGTPPLLAALSMGFNTSIQCAVTHYASGQAASYFTAGYVDMPDWFKMGAVMGVIHFLIWAVVGGIWWKVIGLY